MTQGKVVLKILLQAARSYKRDPTYWFNVQLTNDGLPKPVLHDFVAARTLNV